MTEAAWHDEILTFMTALEYIGTFAGAISGVRLACVKKFDWFGAYVIGLVTALGGGTLRDILLNVEPFWMAAPSYLVATFVAVLAVWLFGRRFISGKITWFIFDTIAISVFTIVGLEKSINCGHGEWWTAILMGVITGVFGGVLRDISINEVPLIFRKEIYALACAAGGLLYYILYWCHVSDPYVRYILGVLVIFAIRALSIKYHLGVPVLSGHAHRASHHHKQQS